MFVLNGPAGADRRDLAQRLRSALAGVGVALLAAACGGGAPGPSNGSGGGTTPPPPPTPELTLRLVDSAGQAVVQLAAGQSAQAQATLTRGGKPLANEIVTFAVETAALATLSPSTGAVLTDSAGVARIALTASTGAAGATRLSASARIGTDSVAASTNFSVGLTGTGGLRISSFTVTTPPGGLSSYGSAPIAVTVTDPNGAPPAQPVIVTFSSTCPDGRASITASATTLPNGTAQGTFTDKGCAPTAPVEVGITAAISAESRSLTFRVNPPTSGSLRFESADPSSRSITLKGQGGVGRKETATLTFRLVDVAGNGVPDADICFDATTYVGGLNLDGFNINSPPPNRGSAELCGSDNALRYVKRTLPDGTVVVQVNSGTTPTPMRVRARTIYPAQGGARLETLSDSVSISTGLPLQRFFDVSISSSNIEGREFSGSTTTLTARLADQFGNPVPDGTVVNFIASGGAICTADSGSCTTVNGVCSCVLSSQEFRPDDGRVVVLAYTVGLEDYTDSNSNNQYDANEPFVDLPDAFLDADKNGTLTPGEITLRYQNPNVYSPTGDGRRDTAHLRRGTPAVPGPMVIFSASNSPTVIIPSFYNDNGAIRIPKSNCSAAGVIPASVGFFLEDGYGNPMPSGSAISTAGGAPIVGGSVDPGSVPNLVIGGPVVARDHPDLPKTSTSLSDPQLIGTGHGLTLTARTAPGGAECITGDSFVEIRVRTPRGVSTPARVLFEGEPRSTPRFAVPVVVQ